MRVVGFAVLLFLMGCGVDGAPEPKGGAGIEVSGTAKIGVSGSF